MRKAILMGIVILVAVACSRDTTPQEIKQARATIKRLKFAPWDVETCRQYQRAGLKVCEYDRASGYEDNGPYDSIGNSLTQDCSEWQDRIANYCQRCTYPGRCDEPFE